MTIKVLAIDDSRTIRSLVRKVMEDAGFQCVVAEDGVEGVHRFAEDNPDIVITDISLPDGSAEQWVSDIVAQGHGGIIISSGHPPGGALADLVTRKAVSVLSKPYELRDVERCMEERRV